MIERLDNWNEATSAFAVVEQQMAKSVAAQKAEIEKALADRINREKEEAQRKIDATEQEFVNVRHVLEEHRTVMSELNTARQRLQAQIKQHYTHAFGLRNTLAQVSAQAAEEWEVLERLKQELDGIRKRAAEKAEFLSAYLDNQFGIKSQFATAFETESLPADYEQAMLLLQKVRDILASVNDLTPAEGETAQEPTPVPLVESVAVNVTEADISETAADLAEEIAGTAPTATGGAAGDDAAERAELSPADERDIAEIEAQPAVRAAVYPQPPQGERLNVLLETLTQYRRTESVANGSVIAYFQKDSEKILDGESFMGTITKIIDAANDLHRQLEGMESLKDLFLLKQEILNEQEILRKVFFRIVKFCDKEGGSLPHYIAEILSSQSLKDILERLTMGNWSNDRDFKNFMEEMTTLRSAILSRTVSSPAYVKSLLDQLDGNNHQ